MQTAIVCVSRVNVKPLPNPLHTTTGCEGSSPQINMEKNVMEIGLSDVISEGDFAWILSAY